MTPATINRLLDFGDRLVKILETRYGKQAPETPNAEMYRRGDPQIAETSKEYRDLPNTGVTPGRFESVVRSRQRTPPAG